MEQLTFSLSQPRISLLFPFVVVPSNVELVEINPEDVSKFTSDNFDIVKLMIEDAILAVPITTSGMVFAVRKAWFKDKEVKV